MGLLLLLLLLFLFLLLLLLLLMFLLLLLVLLFVLLLLLLLFLLCVVGVYPSRAVLLVNSSIGLQRLWRADVTCLLDAIPVRVQSFGRLRGALRSRSSEGFTFFFEVLCFVRGQRHAADACLLADHNRFAHRK